MSYRGDPAADAGFLRAVGERVRVARTRRGMTRRSLAQQSGVSERYIAQLEGGAGNVSLLVLRTLAQALGMAEADLVADPPEQAQALAEAEQLLRRLAAPQLAEAAALLTERFGAGKRPPRQDHIALIGLRGAGKSTLGRMLAESRQLPFYELDREVERASGMALSEIFELHGQAGFRRLERAALERLVANPAGAVVATGGGIVADPATFRLLLDHCLTVWIRATPEEHMARVIAQGDLRPMQDNRQSMADLRAILASREPLYTRADLVLDTSGRTPQESFKALIRLIGNAF
ncbi:MAG: helix-turn-helix transcriptional regulator [Acetobacteraceae bacterium]|nr:helix-turn-helix transcriptional regulator [Acetobacteraceae bacterium]